MFLAGDELTTFTPTYNGVGVRYSSGQKEPLSICLSHERFCTCMTSVESCMNVLQDNSSFI
jgi:hypothetical protein